MKLLLDLFVVVAITSFAIDLHGESSSSTAETVMVTTRNDKDAKRAKVELDMFSGRENPTWTLSRTDTETLLAMIETTSPSHPKPLFDGLGYRGFVVRFPVPVAGVKSVRVFKGTIKLGTTSCREDAERTIERWLLTKAKSALNQQLYELAATEIGADD
jgi:hypothetical protein